MEQINTNKEYNEYVKQKSPNSPILKDCFNAFWVGGLICSIGQIIMDFCKYKGLDQNIHTANGFTNVSISFNLVVICVSTSSGILETCLFSISISFFCKT